MPIRYSLFPWNRSSCRPVLPHLVGHGTTSAPNCTPSTFKEDSQMIKSVTNAAALSCLAVILLCPGRAAEPASPAAADTPADLAKMKAQLDRQQKELEQLQAAVAEQRRLLE